jgi:hypothetical protein
MLAKRQLFRFVLAYAAGIRLQQCGSFTAGTAGVKTMSCIPSHMTIISIWAVVNAPNKESMFRIWPLTSVHQK